MIIKNCPVTIEDVNIAEKIFGADIGTMKGKTTRKKVDSSKKGPSQDPKGNNGTTIQHNSVHGLVLRKQDANVDIY